MNCRRSESKLWERHVTIDHNYFYGHVLSIKNDGDNTSRVKLWAKIISKKAI